MPAAKLLIRKRMLQAHGKVRPTCSVQAVVDPDVQAALETHFSAETLFRRAAYSQNWPEGTIRIPPSVAPSFASFLKNDACPEITVKTLLTGQSHQGANVWEMMCFELIAKVAFDNLLQLIGVAQELDREVPFFGSSASGDRTNFEADAAADTSAPRLAVAAA